MNEKESAVVMETLFDLWRIAERGNYDSTEKSEMVEQLKSLFTDAQDKLLNEQQIQELDEWFRNDGL